MKTKECVASAAIVAGLLFAELQFVQADAEPTSLTMIEKQRELNVVRKFKTIKDFINGGE